jgi:hypothetical protein
MKLLNELRSATEMQIRTKEEIEQITDKTELLDIALDGKIKKIKEE